jgi:cell wall-associated NlpC family hydrolase/regulator of replication initiation timing
VAVVTAAVLWALIALLFPAAFVATPGDSVESLQAEAARVRREVERLDRRAAAATERYNLLRTELDAVNIRLQDARRGLARTQDELDAAQTQRGERLASMYKSDGFSVFDVLFNAGDIGEVDTQYGYFESINEADEATVTRIEGLERSVTLLAAQVEKDRSEALEAEMTLRERQADIEDELARREILLGDLDARIKKLIAQQARLDAAASRRLAREAGVDIATISGTPAQIAVVKESMKYLGIPYVWGGASPSGGFDCSGLVMYVYAKFGVDFLHGATLQARAGDPVPLSKMQPADLVFFGDVTFYQHVGIFIGNGLFIEAPHTGALVKVSRLAGRGCALACRYPISLP